MSVKFTFAGDFNISASKSGRGTSISGPVGPPPGPPPYGTVLGTYSGNNEIGPTTYSAILGNNIYTQSCNANIIADGNWGQLIDWSSVYNVAYWSWGIVVATAPSASQYWGSIEVPSGSGIYYPDSYSDGYQEVWDGAGALYAQPYPAANYLIAGSVYYNHNNPNITEIPNGSNQYWYNNTYEEYQYQANGSGGYNDVYFGTSGACNSNGVEVDVGLRYNITNAQTEVPSGSGYMVDNGAYYFDTYRWDGSCGYQVSTIQYSPTYYLYGTFIYNDGMSDYYWDGNGGYYT